MPIHINWIKYLKSKYSIFEESTIDKILKYEVGIVFKRVLEDCGVFKHNKTGEEARGRYIESLKKYVGVKNEI